MSRSRILVIEGVPGCGKSTLLRALLRRHCARPEKPRTVMYLTQAHTYGPVAPAEDDGTLTAAANLEHLERITGLLEWGSRSVASESVTKFFALVDTLHLTHCHRPGVLRWEHVRQLDARLAALEARLALVTVSPDTISGRCLAPRRGTEFLDEYMRKFGRTEDELAVYLAREQESLRGLAARSAMTTLTVTNDGSPDEVIEELEAFWLERPERS